MFKLRKRSCINKGVGGEEGRMYTLSDSKQANKESSRTVKVTSSEVRTRTLVDDVTCMEKDKELACCDLYRYVILICK